MVNETSRETKECLAAPVREPERREEPLLALIDHELIWQLRSIRRDGENDLAGIESCEPDLSVSLSSCHDGEAATALLEGWLKRRIESLSITNLKLRQAWEKRRSPSKEHITT